MDLCVGAVTRRVIEEAAKLQVPQIVASRRQVDVGRGYTGLDQFELVELVTKLSDGKTKVIRDHGGPYKNGDPDDDWYESLDVDVEAGFDGLHLDVSELPRDEQLDELHSLLDRYANKIEHIEIGGERDEQDWLATLLKATAHDDWKPTYVVIDVGGHIHADRQQGFIRHPDWVAAEVEIYHDIGVKAKAHNADWMGQRRQFSSVLDAINIAPEYAGVETDAWLATLPFYDAHSVLERAYNSKAWTRWFEHDEGTWYERARCAVRYVMEDDKIAATLRVQGARAESWVRVRILESLVGI